MIELNNGVYKSSLIDLEAVVATELTGDRGEGICHAERLNEKTLKEDAKV